MNRTTVLAMALVAGTACTAQPSLEVDSGFFVSEDAYPFHWLGTGTVYYQIDPAEDALYNFDPVYCNMTRTLSIEVDLDLSDEHDWEGTSDGWYVESEDGLTIESCFGPSDSDSDRSFEDEDPSADQGSVTIDYCEGLKLDYDLAAGTLVAAPCSAQYAASTSGVDFVVSMSMTDLSFERQPD
jgi:hypothetical protein